MSPLSRLRGCLCVVVVAVCLLAPSAAAASEPAYTRAPGTPLSVPAANGGSGLAFSPSGSLLAQGTAMFSVAASGALTPIGGTAPDPSATSVAFNPGGTLLAAANKGTNSISMFSVSASGALTSVSGSPFTLGAQPGSVAFSPSGNLLEVSVGESLYMFSVSASGALTPAAGSPYGIKGTGPVAFSPVGGLLAVPDSAGVSMFSVSSSGGLTQVSGSPVALSGAQGESAAFNAAGNVLRVDSWSAGGPGEVITTFSVTSSGALTLVGSGLVSAAPTKAWFSVGAATVATTAYDGSAVYLHSFGAFGALGSLETLANPHPVQNIAFSASGLVATESGALAVFVPSSVSSGTNWVGAFGSEGYDLAGWNGENDLSNLPHESVSLLKGSRCVQAASTTDVRALTGPDGSTRTAAGYCDPSELQVKLTFNAAYTGNLRLYAVDWPKGGSKENETITVGSSSVGFSNNPDMQSQGFSEGQWAIFPISVSAGGSVTITVNANGWPSGAVLSGIFLGDAPPAVTTEPQGSWVGAVGSTGYDLADWDGAGDVSYMPGASISLLHGSRYEWAANTTDTRALTDPGQDTRNAATYYDPNELKLQMSFAAAYTGNLHLYAVDWDRAGRRETITVNGRSVALSSDFSQGAWLSFPISVAAGGTVTITAQNNSSPATTNAVLSGIFLGEAGAPPAATVESAPKGTWVKAVGSGGYDLAGWNGAGGDLADMPGVSLSVQQGSRWQWAQNTADTRALQSPDGLTRNAGTYYDPNQILMQLSFNEAYSGNLHLYAVDWDSQGRRETITVNGQSVTLGSDFSQGAWVTLPISVAAKGTVSITVTRLSGGSAVLSGVFLGGEGPPPAPTVTSAPQGTWVNAVGSAGYALTGWNGANGDVSYLPDAALSLTQGSRYEWAANTADPRALSEPAGHTRNAGTYYDPNEIKLKLSFNEAYSGNLHLYAVDWDSQGRREIITVNGQSAALSSDFTSGAWVSFPISVPAAGTVSITVTRTAGSNAVLSGIFLGDAGAPPAPKVESLPQGTWVGSVGSAGYDLAAENGATDGTSLPGASLTVEQASRYRWVGSTTDVRALQSPDQSTRTAATYYDPNEIKLKLSFNEAYSGNLHLYAVDWDSQGRREIITVNGQSAALSSDFTSGAWVSFPISVPAAGTVSITVTRTAGSNAVLSGIFLGDTGSPAGARASQRALIPLYDNGNPADWTEACSQSSNGSLLIADVAEGAGPGSASVPAWANVIDSCYSYGRASVIGYVWTDYGEGGPASIAGIESQINAWYSYYPGAIAGIFFDGVSDDVPGTSTSNQSFYQTLASYVHTHEGSDDQVVFNFGANPGSGWMLSGSAANNANLVVTFEGSYNTPGEDPYTSWTQAAWESAYPANDFAALIYNAPNEAVTPQPASACTSLAQQNIGYVDVGTWYDELPSYFGNISGNSSRGEC